jgi:hypothetical protein
MTKPAQAAAALAEPWVLCRSCRSLVCRRRPLHVCPECGHHGRLSAAQRLTQLLDPSSARTIDGPAAEVDPLSFVDFKQALPDGFQTAEFLLERGLIDAIRTRSALRHTVSRPPEPRSVHIGQLEAAGAAAGCPGPGATTTIDFLADVLAHQDFRKGEHGTDLADRMLTR